MRRFISLAALLLVPIFAHGQVTNPPTQLNPKAAIVGGACSPNGALVTNTGGQFQCTSGLWASTGGGGGGSAATTTSLGTVKLSTAAADPASPIVVGTNDTRVPTSGQASALAGTSGTPGSGNKYVTDADSRNTNDRVPTDNSVSTAKLVSNAVTAGKLATSLIAEFVTITATAGTQTGRTIPITFQAKDLAGANLTKAIQFKFDAMSSTTNITGVTATTGTLVVYPSAGTYAQTTAAGLVVVEISDSAAEDLTIGWTAYFGAYVDGSPIIIGSGQLTFTYQ